MNMTYITAKRGNDRRWRLFYSGTRNEVFPGSSWPTAAAARAHAAAA
jgi:hypothetical protein